MARLMSMPSQDDASPGIATIARLISGFGRRRTANYREVELDPRQMAKQLRVTFRPLPRGYSDRRVIEFRERLAASLAAQGVTVLDWEEATQDYFYRIVLPLIRRRHTVRARLVRAHVNAVFDVQRKPSCLRWCLLILAELLYFVHTRVLRHRPRTFSEIARLVGWSWDHAVKYIHNHEKTQVVTLVSASDELCDPQVDYSRISQLGALLMTETFSPLVVAVGPKALRVVNLNMADSLHAADDMERFLLRTLVPKLFLPIMPLPLSRFDLGTFDPHQTPYAAHVVSMGRRLAGSGLLPDGVALRDLLWQISYRDMVVMLAQGRTGVSFGFVAYLEPPIYQGPVLVSEQQWRQMRSVSSFDAEELRQNAEGRFYLKLQRDEGLCYHQVPEIWLLSSRSGSRKTHLDLARDLVRIGLGPDLKLQLPDTGDAARGDINPSYDTYVMVAIGLAAAIYCPQLVAHGAGMVHFHGFPSADWFEETDGVAGSGHPSVPCGTFESGVLACLGLRRLARQLGPKLQLACLLEPDHGSNIICGDPDELIRRLLAGCRQEEIVMGGRHFTSAQHYETAVPAATRDRHAATVG